MTDLHKEIRRRTLDPYDHQGRRVVISLLPGDVIGFRWERTRRTFTAPVNSLMRQVIKWTVETERAEKRKARKARS